MSETYMERVQNVESAIAEIIGSDGPTDRLALLPVEEGDTNALVLVKLDVLEDLVEEYNELVDFVSVVEPSTVTGGDCQ